MSIDVRTTVGQLVAERPAVARVFESVGIDYCCGGKVALEDACRAKGLDAHTVAVLLEAQGATSGGARAEVNVTSMGLGELCEHIRRTHHDYLREELPRIGELTRRVEQAHGQDDPRLGQLRRIFLGFADELMVHTEKEERVLFPLIARLEAGERPSGSVAAPIAELEAEHAEAGAALAQMRSLTDGYACPPGACNTYRAMLDALRTLEQDMHRHVHKENSVLFPRAAAVAAGAAVPA